MSPTLVEKLRAMREFRNTLICSYSQIEDENVWKFLMEKHKDFEEFEREVSLFLRKVEK